MTGSGLLLSKTNGMSSSTASLGTVAAAAAAAGAGGGFGDDETQLFDETVDQIKRDHIEAARKIITNSPEVLQEVEEDLEYDCERLRGFLRAAQVRLSSSAVPARKHTDIRTAPSDHRGDLDTIKGHDHGCGRAVGVPHYRGSITGSSESRLVATCLLGLLETGLTIIRSAGRRR